MAANAMNTFLRSAFLQSLPYLGSPIEFNGLERMCIASDLQMKARATNVGLEIEAHPSAQMLREDYECLQLEHRSLVKVDGIHLVFTGLDEAGASDPCVNLNFEHQTPNASPHSSRSFRS